MCGIAGIAAKTRSEEHLASARLMGAALAHRGPDSNGVEAIGHCVLANTRLAIVDLSERGRQPMSNTDSTCWITYNGECYNAAELREWLESRGHKFCSTSDTEVVLHLYDELGDACVERLRGMFAFAIWDRRRNRLLLARDRLGIKPLYYCAKSDRIVFASEIKAILASGLVPRTPNAHGLRAFLRLGHIPPPWTAIEDVQPLEPGNLLTWRDGSIQNRCYWELKPPATNGRQAFPTDVRENLRDLLLEATRLHLIADVPVALFLSGGVDSAVLGALARRAGADRITALTIGFDEKSYDESESSRRSAELLGISHRVLTISGAQMRESVDHAMWAMDQPTVDGMNSYWICRSAAQSGFKAALTGQGGDELFGGYESVNWFERFARAASWLQFLPQEAARAILDHESFPFRWRKLSYLAGADDPFVAAELAVKTHFLDSDVAALLHPTFSSDGSEAISHVEMWAQRVRQCDLQEKIAYLDFHAHLEPRLLRDSDAMSMAHSLELRPVLLDHRVVEFVCALPASVRLRKKQLLLDAVRDVAPPNLLEEVANRPKRTFSFPFTHWLAEDLRSTVEDTFQANRLEATGILNSAAVRAVWKRFLKSSGNVGWSRLWSLFVLQRWCETMEIRR